MHHIAAWTEGEGNSWSLSLDTTRNSHIGHIILRSGRIPPCWPPATTLTRRSTRRIQRYLAC